MLFQEETIRCVCVVIYRVVKPDYMSLEIKTEAENGVILWQGQVSVDHRYSQKTAHTHITNANQSLSAQEDAKLVNFRLSCREATTLQLA